MSYMPEMPSDAVMEAVTRFEDEFKLWERVRVQSSAWNDNGTIKYKHTYLIRKPYVDTTGPTSLDVEFHRYVVPTEIAYRVILAKAMEKAMEADNG